MENKKKKVLLSLPEELEKKVNRWRKKHPEVSTKTQALLLLITAALKEDDDDGRANKG